MNKFIFTVMIATFSTLSLAQDRVAQYDFDKDGKVSFDDINRYCSVSANLFARADKNNDGFLSNSEMRSAKAYLFGRCDDVPGKG
jgi:Ca2+-binding EF-hand superfamily protein